MGHTRANSVAFCRIALTTTQKRIETLSEPAKKSTGRKFATDDEARHCRFRSKKSASAQKAATDYDNDDMGTGGGNDKRNDFIARMEAAEKSKQKVTGQEVLSKVHDAAVLLRAQGQEEAVPDVRRRVPRTASLGRRRPDFIARMSDAAHAKVEKQNQIRAQVIQQESSAMKVAESAKQQFYEKQMVQKNSQRTFLDRNYQSNASSKTKQTQMQSQRAKLLAATCESPVI